MAFSSKRYQDNDIFNLRHNEEANTKKKSRVYSAERISSQGYQRGSLLLDGELICNSCINRELAKSKDRSRPVTRNNPAQDSSIRDFQEKMNMIQKKAIENKVNDRKNLSDLIASSFSGGIPEKDKLINQAAKKTFFLYEEKSDPLKDRTMERFKQKELMLSKSMRVNNDKPEVAQYYEKCVKNCEKEDPFVGYYNPNIPPQSKYTLDLDSQIRNKQFEEERRKRMDRKTANEFIERTNELIEKENIENALIKKKMKEDFTMYNKNLIMMKQRKQEQMKDQNLNEEKAQVKSLQDELEKKRQEDRERDFKNKKMLMKSLNLQVVQKKKNTEMEKARERFDPHPDPNSCECNGMGTCAVCKKMYPKEYLNSKTELKKLMSKKSSI